MHIYDGRHDKKVFPTKHTVAVVSAGRVVGGKYDSYVIRKNGRQDWSLFFCESGCLNVDDTHLDPGQVWIYPPNVPHHYLINSADATAYWYLHFTGSDLHTLFASLGISACVVLDVKTSGFTDIFERIRENMEREDALSSLMAQCDALQLISRVAKSVPGEREAQLMRRVTDSMEHNFAEPYSAALYADMLKLSVSRFNHLFKQQQGISPYAYYSHLRIENARNLLEATNLKIKDIAQKCGYEDPLYFTQAFKRELGTTPSEYRKMIKG